MNAAACRRLLELEARTDLVTFIHRTFQTVVPGRRYGHNWHIEAIAWHLQQCLEGKIRRLIITMPPRSLKSICASVALPAFALGHDPTQRIVAVSYAQDLMLKHARDTRIVMESAWYRKLFPATRIDPRKNTEAEFETTARGYRLGTSVGGTLTGRGGNLIIIDDPMKPSEAMSQTRRAGIHEWYDGTLVSRLDHKASDVIILVMQRLHVDDLVGHVLEKEDWAHLNLPAIAEHAHAVAIGPGEVYQRAAGELLHPKREPLAVLEQQKAAMGSQPFAAQYQQAPVPAAGNLIKRAWLRRYAAPPVRLPDDLIVQSWDTASKAEEMNDFSACTTWLLRGEQLFLLEVFRQRLEYPELRRAVVRQARAHDASVVLIEDTGAGTHLIQELQRTGELFPIGCKVEADKVTRMAAQSVKFEAGQVLLPARAPWLDDFLAELLAFPGGRHDDQVDAVSQALAWADNRWQGPCMVKLTGLY